MTILFLYSLLSFAADMMQGFVYETMLQGNYNCSPYRSFLLQEMKKTCGVTYKRTQKAISTRFSQFSSISLSMLFFLAD
jgi:hypothetical protein